MRLAAAAGGRRKRRAREDCPSHRVGAVGEHGAAPGGGGSHLGQGLPGLRRTDRVDDPHLPDGFSRGRPAGVRRPPALGPGRVITFRVGGGLGDVPAGRDRMPDGLAHQAVNAKPQPPIRGRCAPRVRSGRGRGRHRMGHGDVLVFLQPADGRSVDGPDGGRATLLAWQLFFGAPGERGGEDQASGESDAVAGTAPSRHAVVVGSAASSVVVVALGSPGHGSWHMGRGRLDRRVLQRRRRRQHDGCEHRLRGHIRPRRRARPTATGMREVPGQRTRQRPRRERRRSVVEVLGRAGGSERLTA